MGWVLPDIWSLLVGLWVLIGAGIIAFFARMEAPKHVLVLIALGWFGGWPALLSYQDYTVKAESRAISETWAKVCAEDAKEVVYRTARGVQTVRITIPAEAFETWGTFARPDTAYRSVLGLDERVTFRRILKNDEPGEAAFHIKVSALGFVRGRGFHHIPGAAIDITDARTGELLAHKKEFARVRNLADGPTNCRGERFPDSMSTFIYKVLQTGSTE